MSQFSFLGTENRVLTVSEITRYLRGLLESDYRLQDLWVRGEISNVSTPASGHLYFTIKDSEATLRCVMWRSQVGRQRQLPQAGQSFDVHGHISIYEAGGQYQLYADSLRQAGEGELYAAFLQLKEELEAEGLFAAERKRTLPPFPHAIGVVTSPAAAALQDVLDVLARRFPMAEVVLSPTPVQGAEAPAGIVAALRRLAELERAVDVILLVRGGGSLEDLAAFNSERVARAIADSKVPVVTGVGHETDFTIADFVADLRAPTPSAAAELVAPNREELAAQVAARRRELESALHARLLQMNGRLRSLRAALGRASPRAQLANARQRVDELERRSLAAIVHNLQLRRSQLDGLRSMLRAVGPLEVLQRGFAVVRDSAGGVVRSVERLALGDEIDIRVADGSFGGQVSRLPDDDGQST